MKLLRENFPLLTVDVTLAQLAGAAVFSKLDATVDFGRYRYPTAVDSSLHSSHLFVAIVLINCLLAYLACQSSFSEG